MSDKQNSKIFRVVSWTILWLTTLIFNAETFLKNVMPGNALLMKENFQKSSDKKIGNVELFPLTQNDPSPHGPKSIKFGNTKDLEVLKIEKVEAVNSENHTPSSKIKENYLKSPKHITAQSNVKFDNEIKDAILHGDFTTYQDGNLNEFFSCDSAAPKHISEVCLVNDHFIFVKIPQMRRQDSDSQQCILEAVEEQIEGDERNQNKIVKNKNNNNANENGKTFAKYLNGRNRRISPITPKETSRQKPVSVSWGTSTTSTTEEIFKSRNHGILVVRESQKLKSDFETTARNATIREPLQSVLHTSSSGNIDLEIHGRLQAANADIADSIRLVTKQPSPKPKRALNFSLHWFLKPFQFRSKSKKPNQSNTKKKVQAVVYKTYFVNWLKAGYTSHCCKCGTGDGVGAGAGAGAVLRRTKSAMF